MDRHGIRRLARCVGALLCAGLLGTAAAQPADPAWDQVVAAAKKEGRLVLYSGAATPSTLEPIMAAFQERYGIKVDLLFGRPSETRERIRAEQAAGRVQADLLMDGLTLNIPAFIGSYVPHEPFPNLGKLVPPFKSDGTLVPVGIGRQTVVMNTRLVKPEDEPKSWLDLLDPKWKGKIITDDPRSPGSGSIVFDVLAEKFGNGYLEKLASQKPVIATDINQAERRVAQGEFAFFIPFRIQSVLTLRGLPVKAMRAKEGDVYIVMAMARVKGAPRPNAARLFTDFFLSPEVQRILLDKGYSPVTGEQGGANLPADLRAINQGPLLGATEPTGFGERRKTVSDVFFNAMPK